MATVPETGESRSRTRRTPRSRARAGVGTRRGDGFGCVLVHETGRGAVAWISGDLDRSSAPVLLHQLLEILDLPHDQLTLDLAQVGYLDIHGVTAMNVARKRAESRSIEFVIDGVRDDIRRALQPSALAGSLRPTA